LVQFSKIFFFRIVLFCFCHLSLFAQQDRIDSLGLALKKSKHDSTKLFLMVQLSEECDPNDILKYAGPAIELADKLLQDKSVINPTKILSKKASALNNIGFVYNSTGNVQKALEYYGRSLDIFEQIGDKEGIASTLNNSGIIYYKQGDISKALDYYGRSLKIREETKNKEGIAVSLNNIGGVYDGQGDISKALDYYIRSFKILEEIGDKYSMSGSLNNIGLIYKIKGDIPKALEYNERCLKILEEIGDKQGIANSLNNIGFIYKEKRDISEALNYYSRSLKINEEIGDKEGVASSLNNIGVIYSIQKKYSLAALYLDSSLVLSKQLGYPDNILWVELGLSMNDSATGNFAGAFEHYKQFIIYRDSINNKETRKASIKSQLKYEYEKKEAVIKEQQEKERVVAEEQNRRQQIIIWSVAGGLLLVIVFAGFVFRSLKVTREQKIIIEEKQKEILDSINYAKRIQMALIPSEKQIHQILKKLKTHEGK